MNRTSLLQGSVMLAPLIGASDSLVGAVGLSLLSLLIISIYGMKMRVLRPRIIPPLQLLTSIVLAAALTSFAALALQAWSLELHRQLGIYIALIALQCVALEHNGFFTRTHLPGQLRLAMVFASLMVVLGILREALGRRSFAAGIPWLTDSALATDGGIRLAVIAPGGFILLGLLLAAIRARPGHSTSP
ncbi:electron transport complex protein RnfE [Pseudomonas sp. ok272]|uniref:Rnf-Nqr domain containing protein n=1 Tax=unclassified Pseudomonas TaxID=196821 RepID=UPI0008C8921F|nr:MULTISPECIES: Rnf-Nqr domain containing protein [unclassified Pseudomonas]SEN13671.1 electron transport complex protein RnfE [Pseudomonas sp. ok272]SFN06303.1 electron transport complex protein RnfE [Pseudomonas sp. ok602]